MNNIKWEKLILTLKVSHEFQHKFWHFLKAQCPNALQHVKFFFARFLRLLEIISESTRCYDIKSIVVEIFCYSTHSSWKLSKKIFYKVLMCFEKNKQFFFVYRQNIHKKDPRWSVNIYFCMHQRRISLKLLTHIRHQTHAMLCL